MTISPNTALAPVLRSLKLARMLETLDARLAEARAGTLGHVEFLQVLCEDELARREAAAVSRRLRAATCPARQRSKVFRLLLQRETAHCPSATWLALEFIAADEGPCTYGPVGVGKTHCLFHGQGFGEL